MLQLTFDKNIIVDLEEKREGHEAILDLIRFHNEGKLKICVPEIIHYENKKKNGLIDHNNLKIHLASIGLETAEILTAPGLLDMTFFLNQASLSSVEIVELEKRIEAILHKKITRKSDLTEKQRNVKCDVIAMLSHIVNKKDIFVTRDGNFHKETKKPALIQLGAKEILYPHELRSRFS